MGQDACRKDHVEPAGKSRIRPSCSPLGEVAHRNTGGVSQQVGDPSELDPLVQYEPAPGKSSPRGGLLPGNPTVERLSVQIYQVELAGDRHEVGYLQVVAVARAQNAQPAAEMPRQRGDG